MKHLRPFRFFVLCFLVLLCSGARAEVPPTAPPVNSVEMAAAIALAHRAETLKKAFVSGDERTIKAAVQDVELLRRTYGTLDVMPLVDAMALWARAQGDSGNPSLGLQVVQTMERWAPRQPILLGTRVILLRQQSFKGYIWSLPEVLELAKIRLEHPTHRWLWVVQHVAWLRMLASLLLWGWALVLALRYRNVFRYLWENALSRRVNSITMAIIGAVILSLPVLISLDPSVSALLWLLLLAPFMLGAEVKATLFVVILQFLHPALALMEPEASIVPPPSILTLQLQPQNISIESLGARALPAPDQAFLRGWRQLQAQDWAAAESTFESLVGKHPDQAEVRNNLGVARFQQDKVDAAKQDFDEAARLASPPHPEIFLNQSVVAFKQLDSVTGAAKQEEARQLAPDAVNGLLAANQSRNDQRAFGSPLPESPERQAALRVEKTVSDASLSERGKSPEILFGLLIPFVALLALLIRLSRSIKQAHPTQCSRCGEPFHTTDCPDVNVCSRCHHLFILKDGLHGESRKRKVEEVATHQRSQQWIHRCLIVLLPGLDLCFLGETRDGLLEFIFLCLAAGVVLATGRPVRFPGEILADPSSTWQPLGLCLLAILFLRSWFKLLPRRS